MFNIANLRIKNIDHNINDMVFFALISLLQICFIPGFIVYLFLSNRSAIWTLLAPVLIFGLSLVINYCIVISLAYFGIYHKLSLLILLLTESLILTGIFLLKRGPSIKEIKNIIREFIFMAKRHFEIKDSLNLTIRNLFFIISVIILIWMITVLLQNTGKIFDAWDAIFSYNKWAIDFYNNSLPNSTYHYPQLIPANWSIAYVYCGYPLQFLPKIIMHFFLISMVYTLLIVGVSSGSSFLLFACPFLFLSYDHLSWTDGMVDIPVGFYSFLVFVTLYGSRIENNYSDKLKLVLLSIVFTCASALTKQAGLFLVLIFPVLLVIFLKDNFKWTFRDASYITLIFLCLVILLVVPYYIWCELQIDKGNAASEINYVTQEIHRGATYGERLVRSFGLFGKIFWAGIPFFLLSLWVKTFRWIIIVFVFPYFLIWSLFFSYDVRNVSLAIPYYCLGIGYGLEFAVSRLPRQLNILSVMDGLRKLHLKTSKRTRFLIVSIITVTSILYLLYLNQKMTLERLIKAQEFRQTQIYEKDLHEKLYQFNSESPIDKKILTNYHYLEKLPEIGKYCKFFYIENLESKSGILQDTTIGFILWKPVFLLDFKTTAFIDSAIASGQYREIFEHNGYRFIKIR